MPHHLVPVRSTTWRSRATGVTPQFTHLAAVLACAVAMLLSVISAPVAVAEPTPSSTGEAGLPACERPLILVARGSDEPYVPPFLLGYSDPQIGWGGITLVHFLAAANIRNADIIALGPDEYPAISVGNLNNVPNGVPTPLDNSINSGVAATIRHHDAFVRDHGCQPKTILMGYSQGAMVMQRAERTIAERGNLAGVVYFGNPLRSAHDPAVIGATGNRVGLQTYLDPRENSLKYRAATRVIDFCLPQDPVCDQPGRTADEAMTVHVGTGGMSLPIPRTIADLTNPIFAFPYHVAYFWSVPPSVQYEHEVLDRLYAML